MKILLDECLPVDFRNCFPDHVAYTAQWAGFKGKKNGDLLRDSEIAGYDVLLTVDQGMSRQRSSAGAKLSMILVRPPTNQIEDLLPLVNAILRALETIQPGEVVAIPSSD